MSHKQAKAARKASRLAGYPKKAGITPDFHIADHGVQATALSKHFIRAGGLGLDGALKALSNRIHNLSGRSKYMPHQGNQECARRMTEFLF